MDYKVKEEIISWVKTLVVAVVLAFLCQKFLFLPVGVSGESMLPTLKDRDRIIVSRTTSIDRFDIIVFDSPTSDEDYIKRVIGIPGDKLEFKNDVLYINGELYEENYVKNIEGLTKVTGDLSLEKLTGYSEVPENRYFVLGDNRGNSKDSRYFGFITEESIAGEALFRFYPFDQLGKVN